MSWAAGGGAEGRDDRNAAMGDRRRKCGDDRSGRREAPDVRQIPLEAEQQCEPAIRAGYPVEWGCTLRTVEIVTRVQPGRVKSLLADTPFEIASDRVAFRFMLSPGHSLAVHAGRMFDTRRWSSMPE
jgi:acetoacetate decarboxylase